MYSDAHICGSDTEEDWEQITIENTETAQKKKHPNESQIKATGKWLGKRSKVREEEEGDPLNEGREERGEVGEPSTQELVHEKKQHLLELQEKTPEEVGLSVVSSQT